MKARLTSKLPAVSMLGWSFPRLLGSPNSALDWEVKWHLRAGVSGRETIPVRQIEEACFLIFSWILEDNKSGAGVLNSLPAACSKSQRAAGSMRAAKTLLLIVAVAAFAAANGACAQIQTVTVRGGTCSIVDHQLTGNTQYGIVIEEVDLPEQGLLRTQSDI